MGYAQIRHLIISVSIAVWAFSPISAQNTFQLALSDLSNYLGSAVRLIGDVIRGVDKIDRATIPGNDRQEAVKQLTQVSFAIQGLLGRQAPLIKDLSRYAAAVRKNGFVATDDTDKEWKLILASTQGVSAVVRDTYQLAATGTLLKVAIGEEDKRTLDGVLLARAGLLGQLAGLRAPGTREEIEQLEALNQNYSGLFKALGTLQGKLLDAAARIK